MLKKYETLKKIGENKIVAIVRVDDAEKAEKCFDALKEGGINVIEIHHRRSCGDKRGRQNDRGDEHRPVFCDPAHPDHLQTPGCVPDSGTAAVSSGSVPVSGAAVVSGS